jgi:L-alanine-DL-glutamate epimerase-like enolase superfamily enzyme
MIGCMSETSCATAAAAHLAMADWVEFRWNLGVTNDPFRDTT